MRFFFQPERCCALCIDFVAGLADNSIELAMQCYCVHVVVYCDCPFAMFLLLLCISQDSNLTTISKCPLVSVHVVVLFTIDHRIMLGLVSIASGVTVAPFVSVKC